MRQERFSSASNNVSNNLQTVVPVRWTKGDGTFILSPRELEHKKILLRKPNITGPPQTKEAWGSFGPAVPARHRSVLAFGPIS